MEELLNILKGIRPDVDFEARKDLIDAKVLDSMDIISLVAEINDSMDIQIPAEELLPENFNSAEALYALLQRLEEE